MHGPYCPRLFNGPFSGHVMKTGPFGPILKKKCSPGPILIFGVAVPFLHGPSCPCLINRPVMGS